VQEIVPNLFIWEFTRGTEAFKFRLAGTNLRLIFGREMTGLEALSDWAEFEKRAITNAARLTVNNLQPMLARMRFHTENQEQFGAEMLALPIKRKNQDGVHIIGGLFPFSEPRLPMNRVVAGDLLVVRNIWTEYQPGDLLLRTVERRGVPLLRVITGGRTE
jgi:hypothetical protein